jgi:hypothetical protein
MSAQAARQKIASLQTQIMMIGMSPAADADNIKRVLGEIVRAMSELADAVVAIENHVKK